MRFLKSLWLFGVLLLAAGCTDGDESLQIFSQTFDFAGGDNGWIADFTDYPVGETPESDTIYQWKAEMNAAPFADGRKAIMLSCQNRSGDVFMFLKRKIEHLRPSTNYTLVFEVSSATNATAGQTTILKAGASDVEPKKVIEAGYYVLNLDKGDGTSSGEHLSVIGDVSGISYHNNLYIPVTKGNANSFSPYTVKTNSKGELWLIVGTDSFYEGLNVVYYTAIDVIFSVSN